jgi:nitrogen fixation/metabolism regulation signal transduction histidine kinase
MGFYDAFFGSDQSQYTAYAIVAAIIAICITILLTATDIPVSNRLLIVFFVIISLVPSVFLTLFELTCIVTGGTEPNKWWCYAFAWVLAAFIIIYCIFIVIISLISLFTYNNAIDNVTETENKSRLSPEVSNNYAKQIIENDEKQAKQIEKFYNDSMTAMMNEANPTPDDKKEINILNPATAMAAISGMMNTNDAGDTFINNEHFEATKSPAISKFTNDISSHPQPPTQPPKPQIASFENKPSMKSQFSNFGANPSDEEFTDGYFPYDKFAAN